MSGGKNKPKKRTAAQRLAQVEANTASHEVALEGMARELALVSRVVGRMRKRERGGGSSADVVMEAGTPVGTLAPIQAKLGMAKHTVEFLHHDSPMRYKHFGVTALVNGPHWVELYKDDGAIIMFPNREVFRLRITPEKR